MKQLKYFILGIISILWIFPLSKKLMELINLWFEAWKIKPIRKVLEGNKNNIILKDFSSVPKVVTEYETEYMYDDDYEDDD